MAVEKKEKVKYRQIDCERALRDLRLENPKAYDIVLRLRKEHECLMNLPVEMVIPLQRVAVEGLIANGICKRKINEE